MDSLYP
ncbi:putative regulator of cell, partial [Escherichia coli EC4422]